MSKQNQKPKINPLILFVNEEREPLFSKKNRALLTDPMDDNNPITVQVLGICSALAITVQLKPAIVMSLSVVAVMAASNVIISLLRDLIPNRIRIIVQLWFKELNLSLLIGISMILNMIVAGLFGILVPVSLKKLNIDPALASSVFVTTITDVIGFLSFLGLGSFYFLN